VEARIFSPPSKESVNTDIELCALALMSCPHLGTARLRRAVEFFKGPAGAVDALAAGEAVALSTRRDRVTPSQAKRVASYLAGYDYERARTALAELGGRVIFQGGPAYPEFLASSPVAPPFLVLAGNGELPNVGCVAVVGTRRASVTGLEVAFRLGLGLAERGITVVSGMARGIDAAAHLGALEVESHAGTALSVAVLGCGIDVVYPKCNSKLYRSLLNKGVVVSQYGLGAPPEKWRFPERNRTIAGFSVGVVVVESFLSGGALSTVAAANEIGREVMAVPGSVLSPAASGTNQLIWEGAAPVRSAEDVVECLSALALPSHAELLDNATCQNVPASCRANDQRIESLNLTQAQSEILFLLGDGEPRTLAELSARCEMTPASVIDALAGLSRAGLVVPYGGERFVASSSPHARAQPSYWR